VQPAPVADDGKQRPLPDLTVDDDVFCASTFDRKSGPDTRRAPRSCAPRLGLFSYVVANATAARLATRRQTSRQAGKLLSATSEINKRKQRLQRRSNHTAHWRHPIIMMRTTDCSQSLGGVQQARTPSERSKLAEANYPGTS